MKMSNIVTMILVLIFSAPLFSMKQEKLEAAIRQGNWRAVKAAMKKDARRKHLRSADPKDPEMQESIDWRAISAYASQQYQQAKQRQTSPCSIGAMSYWLPGLLLIALSTLFAAYNAGNDIYDLSQGVPWLTVGRAVPSQVIASLTTSATGLKLMYYGLVQRPQQKVNQLALVKATISSQQAMFDDIGSGFNEVWGAVRSAPPKRQGVAGKKGQGKKVRRLPTKEEDEEDVDLDCSCLVPIIDWLANGGNN